MKRRKKKYNPLKKYQKGGEVKETKPDPKSEKWDEKSSAAFDAYMAGMASAEQDAEPEDLMKGRTFIPRMSAAAKASLMAGAKKLMDKRKDKKLFMDEGGTKEEYRSLSKEMLKNKRRKDLGLDTDTEEKMESKNTNYDPLKKLARPEKEEPEAEETVARYGAKILKKYANGGKTDPKRPTKAKIEAARKERKKDLRAYKTGKKIRKKENQIDAIKDRAAYKNLKMKIKESKR
tara:strand:- start:40 stop:738 length:699 start_codon:yes stop_codon:yes gene_type:complete